MVKKYIGIIGGSGLYNMDGATIEEERAIETPFGKTSDKMLIGKLDGIPVAFMPRHGRGHRFSPSEVNYRANIYAFKTLGVEQILGVSAVGSMKENLAPGHIVIADQLIDRTRSRPYTFFDSGVVAHVSFADPVCHKMIDLLYDAARGVGAKVEKGGTYVCIEGPAFSTRAESNLFRSWGVDVIGMTAYQEARLAREAEICYAMIAMVTDYDCWHEEEADVDVRAIVKTLKNNVHVAQKIIKKALPQLALWEEGGCCCNAALKNAIMTDPKLISAEVKKRLGPIVGKYIK